MGFNSGFKGLTDIARSQSFFTSTHCSCLPEVLSGPQGRIMTFL